MTPLLTLLLACRPGTTTADSATVPDPDSGTSDSRPDSDLRVSGVHISGAFGYDPELGGVPYYFGSVDEPSLKPFLEITFSLEADGQLPGPCRLTLQVEPDTMPGASWATSPVMFGVDFDWDLVGYDDTCPPMDPTLYPQDLLGLAQHWTFGLGVLPLTDDVIDDIEADIVASEGQVEWDDYWVDNVVGGAVSWTALDQVWTGGWALGFEVDEDMVLTARAPDTPGPPPPHDPSMVVPLSREVIEASTGLPRGVYAVDSLSQFDPEALVP